MTLELDLLTLHTALKDIPLGGIRIYQTIGSTNDEAIAWAGENALDMSLVIADEQTSGRGRNGRNWYSPAGSSLAFSLILRMEKTETRSIGLYSALGALAVVQAIIETDPSLEPSIKWPNDVLLKNKKVCGILSEAAWSGDRIENLVIGIGINVSQGSIPPDVNLNFPATYLEECTSSEINRYDLIRNVLNAILKWRKLIGTSPFIGAWQDNLAFRGEKVNIWSENSQPREGIITGLAPDGSLCLQDSNGKNFTCHFGEVHLMPIGL